MQWKTQTLLTGAIAATMTSLGLLGQSLAPRAHLQAAESAPTLEAAPAMTAGGIELTGDGTPFLPPNSRASGNPFPFRAVIRGDDRVPMMSRSFPWSAVGRVEGLSADGRGYSCTGTLIAPSVVLTNAHCVVNPKTHQVSKALRFKPNLINGKLRDNGDVAYVVKYHYATDFRDSPTVSNKNDWALLQLNKPLGKKYGFLGWKAFPAATLMKNPKKLSLVGYSGDFPGRPDVIPGLELTAGPGQTAGVHRGCSVVGERNGLLLHDCDTSGGASGGPILGQVEGKYYVVGLHAGWKRVDGNVLNYAVQMSEIQTWLRQQSQK